MTPAQRESLQALRRTLADIPAEPWEGVAAWVARAAPHVRVICPEHLADFQRLTQTPLWTFGPIVGGGGRGPFDDPPWDNSAEVRAADARANSGMAQRAKKNIEEWLDGVLESAAVTAVDPESRRPGPLMGKPADRVFVVHGHDENMKSSVARALERLSLKAVILHEQPNRGLTIIEKLGEYSDVGFAVVLLSPDDLAHAASSPPETARPRARQNVILELGYFLGLLGRERVLALHREAPQFELPSDYSGVLFVPFDERGRWAFDLVRELRAAGYDVDANQLVT